MRRAVLLAFLLPAAALAAPAVPDRPRQAATSQLVSSSSIEGELGGTWTGSGTFGMPLLVKYSYQGTLEPRAGVDLAGIDHGAPGLAVGAKVKLVASQTFGLGLLAQSNVPLGSAEHWLGTVRLLSDVELSPRAGFCLNLGADLGRLGGTVGVTGVPVALAADARLFGSLSGFVEGATVFAETTGGTVVDAGLGWRVTDAAVLDAAAGWSFAEQDPFVALGVSLNAGRPGG